MSKEIKPIFIVRLPKYYDESEIERISIDLSKRLKDYNIICVQSNREEVEFECYNLQGDEPINLDELKEILKSYED